MPTPLPWSHSSLTSLDTCPRQYEEVKVHHHFQQLKNDASVWGDEVHVALENYLNAKGAAALGPRFTAYQNYVDQYLKLPGEVFAERKYALDRALKPCDFYAPQVWGRGIIDVLNLNGFLARVFDHKTGKRKKDMQQLIIFALLVFYHHPEILECEVTFAWLATGEKDTETFQRAQIPELWAVVLPKLQQYAQAFHSGVFRAKPSGLCKKHCPVDTCEYYQRGRY